MEIIDFTNSSLSSRNLEYAGRAGEKRGIIYNNENWFLKFPKNTLGMDKVNGLSYVTSPLSEFLGSQIYKILGYDVHDTILGIYNDGKRNKVVCACKDFIIDDKNEILIPYTALRNDTSPIILDRNEDSLASPSNLNEIVFQLQNNAILSKIKDASSRFFEVLIIDMLINNNDRNEDNWGVIKYKNLGLYKLSPIYDCGNSFYGKTSEERIKNILSDEIKLESSALNGITAYEDDNEHRISIMKILDFDNQDLQKAILKVYKNFTTKLNDIYSFINDIPNEFNGTQIISNARKEYYIKTIEIRYKKLLKNKYDQLQTINNK